MTIERAKTLIDHELNEAVKKLHDAKSDAMRNYYLGMRAGLESAYALLCEEK